MLKGLENQALSTTVEAGGFVQPGKEKTER